MTRLRAVAMVAGILAFLCLGGALASFAALNTHWVIVRAGVVTFDGLEPSMVVREWDAQLYGLLLGALIAGWCAATLAYLPLWLRRTMRANRDRRYIDELEQELVELRNMPVTNPTPLEDLPDETPATASRQASKSEEELTAELLAGLSDDEEQSAAAPRRLQDQGAQ
ncbi:MAG: LapA family protein [Deltaproteobacteria bacterium]|nr:LapA family protein [Deltaproteobacteria bacterium]